ncbi:hypothetical protein D3C72_1450210 [compost metagenome]
MFIRDGTPSGFSTMSTVSPEAMYGMSSTGTTLDTTPLLPWRPAILSPGWMRRFTARNTLTIFSTPGARSSPAVILPRLSAKRRSNSFSCAWICFCARSMASAASSSFMRSTNQSAFFRPSR